MSYSFSKFKEHANNPFDKNYPRFIWYPWRKLKKIIRDIDKIKACWQKPGAERYSLTWIVGASSDKFPTNVSDVTISFILWVSAVSGLSMFTARPLPPTLGRISGQGKQKTQILIHYQYQLCKAIMLSLNLLISWNLLISVKTFSHVPSITRVVSGECWCVILLRSSFVYTTYFWAWDGAWWLFSPLNWTLIGKHPLLHKYGVRGEAVCPKNARVWKHSISPSYFMNGRSPPGPEGEQSIISRTQCYKSQAEKPIEKNEYYNFRFD